ncbi:MULTISPECIES: endonuclease/exonuclease/phosphatase family protein [Actinomadura]|uniref:Endonuclease/exonuclease/phosphatase family protein n=1 Tax=Actinomadura yumaensis TaxID=111807 RepID=A0ABW2C9H4_9ACTN|nr:endonuclease/exonuclease/phosphatase family protein [Actinomadura sp. J1-007]MWK33862.1 metal-dependent hydrolase [Actinomadura sp. J1-007]
MRGRVRLDVLLGAVVLVDVLRVFLPSLITLVGSAGETPAELMGAYALSWFAAAFLAVPLARIVPARGLAAGAGAALVLARIALQATDGGDAQLYAASAGLLAGLVWLVATAMAARDAGPALGGFVAGLAAATALHAALDGVDLVWRAGVWPWVPLAVYLGLFAAALLRAPDGEGAATAPRAWAAAGPALLLWGVYTGNEAHAQASSGWSGGAAAAVIAAGAVLSVAVAAAPRSLTRHPAVPAAALVVSALGFAFGRATVDGVHGVSPWWTVIAQVLGQLALAGCLGWAAALPGPDRPSRRGIAVAAGTLLFVLLVFAYYAAYDLGVPNRWVPVATALCVALLTVRGTARGEVGDTAGGFARGGGRGSEGRLAEIGGPGGLRVVAAAGAAVLAVAAVPLWRGDAPEWAPPSGGLRVAAYNLRMGYGMDGTMSVARQADALRSLRPHVVVLGEVDRAWMLNGGRDQLRLLSGRLGLRHAVWAPAGDEVWGDAVLTDLPVTSVRNEPLVEGGPTGAQALRVGVRWRGRDVAVIATHTQPPDGWKDLGQAEQLARMARDAARGGRPVVLAGDLNLQPGDRPWDVLLGAGLTDAFASVRPLRTFPASPRPDEQLDHVLVTPDLVASDPASPAVTGSDHRPVAVTLAPRS